MAGPEEQIKDAVDGARTVGLDDFELPSDTDFDGDLGGWCSWRPRNDLGNAQRLIARHGADLVWLRRIGWLAWDGRRWNRNEGPERAQLAAQATAEAIRAEARAAKAAGDGTRAKALSGWARYSGASGRIAAMQREAAPRLVRVADDMDRDPVLLTVLNGTVELLARVRLRGHRREDLLTRLAPVLFDEGSRAPVFEAFVERIVPDAEVRAFLQRWFGYCLTGDTSEQVVVMLWGAGSNGKSTLLFCLGHVFEDLHEPLPFASFVKDDRRRGSEATPDLALLPGARLVTASEPETGARLSESMIKWMTGGERMKVRHLNHGFFDFQPQFKVTLAFNNKPSVRGQDKGIWRRLLLVPFTEEIGKAQVAPVRAALEDEGPGILNWLLDGVEMWREAGLMIPERVRAATEDYRADSDPVGRFLSECTARRERSNVKASELWEVYERWCRAAAEEPVTRRRFGLILRDKGVPKEKIGVYYYGGLEVTDHMNLTSPPAAGPAEGET